jgi:hypothetical protein
VFRDYSIDDDLSGADSGAVEVTVTMSDGSRRWLFFMTPAGLAACGDQLPGTQVRLHLGEWHMIVVSELSRDIIERVLHYLDEAGALEMRTIPLGAR